MNLALSFLSAGLLVLIYPRFNIALLAPVALAPILYACARESSWTRRLWFGWAAGIVQWMGICYWIQFVLATHGGLNTALSWVALFLFGLMKGMPLAFFCVLAGPLIRRPWAIPATAALWAGVERIYWPFGFTWLNLGNAGLNAPLLMRLAPVTGVYGISFAFAMMGCAVALLALRRTRAELVWLLAIPALWLLPTLPPHEPGREPVRVVQPNIDTETDWTTGVLSDLEQRMTILSHDPGVPLIVWPEAPAPFYPTSPEFRHFLEQVAISSDAHVMFGGVTYTARREPLNSVFFTGKDGVITDRYDKINLVPFGEYVPPIFGWVNRITQEAGDFSPGERIVTFNLDGHSAGAFICYESAFPDLVRKFTVQGAGVLLNLSNDGYFGESAAREQHLALVRMRAAENHRWILRATNDGITAMINPAGRITEQLKSFTQAAATMRYNRETVVTPYTSHGDWFAWSCLAVSVLLSAFQFRRGLGTRALGN